MGRGKEAIRPGEGAIRPGEGGDTTGGRRRYDRGKGGRELYFLSQLMFALEVEFYFSPNSAFN